MVCSGSMTPINLVKQLSEQCLTMQAVLHMSAGVLYPEPMSTSKERYCRVWMSSVKCLCWYCGGKRRSTLKIKNTHTHTSSTCRHICSAEVQKFHCISIFQYWNQYKNWDTKAFLFQYENDIVHVSLAARLLP